MLVLCNADKVVRHSSYQHVIMLKALRVELGELTNIWLYALSAYVCLQIRRTYSRSRESKIQIQFLNVPPSQGEITTINIDLQSMILVIEKYQYILFQVDDRADRERQLTSARNVEFSILKLPPLLIRSTFFKA